MKQQILLSAHILAFLVGSLASAGDDEKTDSGGIPKTREPWTTSRFYGTPEPPPPYQLRRVFPEIELKLPVELIRIPGTEQFIATELEGRVYAFSSRSNQKKLVADLNQVDGFHRVYGMVLHPKFPEVPEVFICYVIEGEHPDGTRVSRFTLQPGVPPTLDTASEQIVLTWRSGGHNGGCLRFGPDGYLYISTGDASGPFPPDIHDAGQDISNVLASILRIDVLSPSNQHYLIPKDNPFLSTPAARGEVWAYGFRNPWKMSFDSKTGELWVGDVGWEMWELVYRIERGGNYGWSIVEGSQPVHQERTRGPTPIIPPTVEHSHIESRSVTGGFVYRGRRFKELVGTYVYGDYVTGKIWSTEMDTRREKVRSVRELADSPAQIICFAEDDSGELIVVDYAGTLHELVPSERSNSNRPFPKRLSETGLFESTKQYLHAKGVIPYQVSAEPWMDFATADRFIAVPGYGKLGIHSSSNVQQGRIKGAWSYPEGTVLAKTIWMERRKGNPKSRFRLETQILHRIRDDWWGYNYKWLEDQSDAVLLPSSGETRTITVSDPDAAGGKRIQSWHHAGRTECFLCHTSRSGTVQGFIPEQLSRFVGSQETQQTQLAALAQLDLFEQPTSIPSETYVSPYDATQPLDRRARTYLHLNCAHCHRRGGGGTAALDVRFDLALSKTNLLGERPTQGTFGIHRAEIVRPGDPFGSVLFYRTAKTGRGRMPHIGSREVDEQGVALLYDWISSLDSTARAESRDLAEQAIRDLRRLQRADGPRIQTAVKRLVSSTTGAMILLHALHRKQLEPIRDQVISVASQAESLEIQGLFERFVPYENRVKRLGQNIEPEAILTLTGNPTRGETLWKSSSIQCRSCHKLRGVGGDVGPDLATLAKKLNREQILEAILKPSKTVDPKYVTYLVETAAGKVVTGLMHSRTENEVVLRKSDGKLETIARAEIEQLLPQRQSIMPDALLAGLTAQQTSDLLEYLVNVQTTASAQ